MVCLEIWDDLRVISWTVDMGLSIATVPANHPIMTNGETSRFGGYTFYWIKPSMTNMTKMQGSHDFAEHRTVMQTTQKLLHDCLHCHYLESRGSQEYGHLIIDHFKSMPSLPTLQVDLHVLFDWETPLTHWKICQWSRFIVDLALVQWAWRLLLLIVDHELFEARQVHAGDDPI